MRTLYVPPQLWISPEEIEAARINHLYINRQVCLIDGTTFDVYLHVDSVGESRLTEEVWTSFGGTVLIVFSHKNKKQLYTYQAVCPKKRPMPPFKILRNVCVITLGDQM